MSVTTDILGIVQLWHAPLIVLVLIFVALAFDFINGFHDAANSIATVVSTRENSAPRMVRSRNWLEYCRGVS